MRRSDVIREQRAGHRLVIDELEVIDGEVTAFDVYVKHPPECCVNGWGETEKCAVGHLENAIGTREALYLDDPTVRADLLGLALTTGRAEFPLSYRYASWIDYWGESDMEFQWWPFTQAKGSGDV